MAGTAGEVVVVPPTARSASLGIQQASVNHDGNYTCHASSEAGTFDEAFNIHVDPKDNDIVNKCRCTPWSINHLPHVDLRSQLKITETPKDDILGPSSKLDLMLCVCPKISESEKLTQIKEIHNPGGVNPNKPTGSGQDGDWDTSSSSNSLENTGAPVADETPEGPDPNKELVHKPQCVCVDVDKCPSLDMIYQDTAEPEKDETLREARCGPNSMDSFKVTCCERTTCLDPQLRPGVCKNIRYCRHLARKVLYSVLTPDILEDLRKHVCVGPEEDSVCCADPNAPPGSVTVPIILPELVTTPEPEPSPCPDGYDNALVDPCPWDTQHDTSSCCGDYVEPEERVLGGYPADIAEFPWMAILEYDLTSRTSCAGVLISNSLVLTAAHCVHKDKPTGVLLGEFDTSNSKNETDQSANNCRESTPISIEIEHIVEHELYVPNSAKIYGINDIALIRMKMPAPSSESIRPICLPTIDLNLSASERPSDNSVSEQKELLLKAVGWGLVDEVNEADILQQVSLPFVEIKDCINRRYRSRGNTTLSPKFHICAGGEKDRDVCSGDSGGPLMRRTKIPVGLTKKFVYELVGLVSFGERCKRRAKTAPGVYTNVYHYINWIEKYVKLWSS